MAVIDVLRPSATADVGLNASPTPSGSTLHAVTADGNDNGDNSGDSTYIRQTHPSGTWYYLNLASHTPPTNHQRHALRARARLRTSGTVNNVRYRVFRFGEPTHVSWGPVIPGSSFDLSIGSWALGNDFPQLGLNTVGALSTLFINSTCETSTGGQLDTAALYVDIDCRARPDYTPQVRDLAGVSQNGGTVTDTNKPILFFGAVDYDDLPALDWSVSVDGSTLSSGTGVPPTSVQTGSLLNGSHVAVFTVRSTIRGADPFPHVQTIFFDVDFQVDPPPPPANVTVVDTGDGMLVSWEDPGGSPWDDNYVIAEVWRDDCHGSVRIANIENGLTGSYLDRYAPVDDRTACNGGDICTVTYRVRYWGVVSETVEAPSTIPNGLIVGWPSTVGSIPSGWSRVDDLNDRYVIGATGTTTTGTGGSTSHSHTTPGHTHTIDAHNHTMGGSTNSSNDNTIAARFNGATEPQANQPHTHTLPGSSHFGGGMTSGSASPSTDSANNFPQSIEVIFIQSDGTPTSFTPGMLAWSTEDIPGWINTDSTRFLSGASVGGDGGAEFGSPTHTHTVASHSHTGGSHSHGSDATGLSAPVGINAGYGSTPNPQWLARHTHPVLIGNADTGSTNSASGGTTGAATSEPPYRILNLIENDSGGLQTRLIGLYRGDSSLLPSTLVRCDGSNGTPDMRGLFARGRGPGENVGATGGSNTHSHTTPSHSHTMNGHTHTISIGQSGSTKFNRPTFGDLGNVPIATHTHTVGFATGSTAPNVQSASSGNTDVVNHVPSYAEAHFVRLEGVGTAPIDIPQILSSEFSQVVAAAPAGVSGSDLLVGSTGRLAICPDRSITRPRQSVVTVPIIGGLPQVSTTVAGTDVELSIPIRGRADLIALEALLAETLLYYQPWGSEPGWYAPGGYTVTPAMRGVKVVVVTLVKQDGPVVPDPEGLL